MEIFSLQLTSTLSDRSFELFSKQMGKHGRVVSCTVVGAPDVSQARGRVLVQAFIAKTAPQGTRIVQTLGIGYFYNGPFLPGGHGSMPFDSTDYLLVVVANSIATNRLSIQLGITEDEGGPTYWELNRDTETHGAIMRAAASATAVGGSAGIALTAVPVNAHRRFLSGVITYVATGTVGTRAVEVRFRDASATVFMRSNRVAPTAGQTAILEFAPNLTSEGTVLLGGSASIEFASPDRALPASYDVSIFDTANIDVADTAALEAQVEEFLRI